jgi:prefoldin subunit 5
MYSSRNQNDGELEKLLKELIQEIKALGESIDSCDTSVSILVETLETIKEDKDDM